MKSLLIALLLLFAVSCKDHVKPQNSSDTETSVKAAEPQKNEVLKIYLDENGVITANGNTIQLDSLGEKLVALKKANGTVYYSRANKMASAPKLSMDIMQIVVKNQLPVQFYTDSTFQTVVEMKAPN